MSRFAFAVEVARLLDGAMEWGGSMTRFVHDHRQRFVDDPHTPAVRYFALHAAFEEGSYTEYFAGQVRSLQRAAAMGDDFPPERVVQLLITPLCRGVLDDTLIQHVAACSHCRANAHSVAQVFFLEFANSGGCVAVPARDAEDAKIEATIETFMYWGHALRLPQRILQMAHHLQFCCPTAEARVEEMRRITLAVRQIPLKDLDDHAFASLVHEPDSKDLS